MSGSTTIKVITNGPEGGFAMRGTPRALSPKSPLVGLYSESTPRIT